MPASINKLNRMGLIKDGEISETGELLLFACLDNEEEVATEKVSVPSNFDEIWLLFPRDDGYRNFSTSRTIRWNKKETKAQYELALKLYSHKDLVNALKREITYRSSNSTKENLFKYMKGSINWFKDQSYLNFIDEENVSSTNNEFGKTIS